MPGIYCLQFPQFLCLEFLSCVESVTKKVYSYSSDMIYILNSTISLCQRINSNGYMWNQPIMLHHNKIFNCKVIISHTICYALYTKVQMGRFLQYFAISLKKKTFTLSCCMPWILCFIGTWRNFSFCINTATSLAFKFTQLHGRFFMKSKESKVLDLTQLWTFRLTLVGCH